MNHIQRLGAVMLLGLALPAVAHAQTAADQPCEMMPSLGIDGISCRNCSLSFADGRRFASFGTEPEILAVAPDGASAGLLRAGDLLVAVDGLLITTRGGGEAYSSYEVGDVVRLTVRRDGRERDVELEAGEDCRPSPPKAPIAPEAIPYPAAPQPDRAPTALRAPSPPTAPPSVRAPSRGPVPVAAPEPLSTLAGNMMALSRGLPDIGLALSCTNCSLELRDDARAWDFSEPPRIRSVEPGSPADVAGIRAGDRVVRVDGLPITSARGGERLARLEPGREVDLALERDGLPVDVTLAVPAFVPPSSPPSPPTAAAAAGPTTTAPVAPRPVGPLRQVSRLGDVDIEVRGEGAVYIQEGDLIIIRSQGLEVRLRRRAGG